MGQVLKNFHFIGIDESFSDTNARGRQTLKRPGLRT